MTDGDRPKIDLNPPALRPVAEAPWRDDTLQRRGIASKLDALVTDLIGGAEPVTIALDGGYGTGKTFILERWVQEIVGRGQVAVYYNAWENDCDDDPLVSLIETLTTNEKTDWGKRLAPSLNVALSGILHKYTGIDAQKAWTARQDPAAGLLDAARHRRESRQKLKNILTDLVDAAGAREFPGVVVVVDELDRCRPTFANELMERVKHVLNVPGLVFVFGVNIVALRKTVRAFYGDIDAHQYLLRMFTVTLHMPPGAPLSSAYLQGLVDRHGLREFCNGNPYLKRDLDIILDLFEFVATAGRLTPREMERAVWLLSKVAAASLDRDGQVNAMFPLVLLPLAIVRVKNPDAYYETVSRPDSAPAVINCFFELIHEPNLRDRQLNSLDRLEMTMYRVCHRHPSPASEPPAYVALREFATEEGGSNLNEQYLSRRLTRITKERARELLEVSPQKYLADGGTWAFGPLQSITSRFDLIWPKDQMP